MTPPTKNRPTVLVKIGGQGRLTLPSDVRKAAQLKEGQVVEITIVDDDTLVIRAKHLVDRKQAWVWSDAWLEKLSAAQDDLAEGRTTVYETDEDFLASLDG